MLVGPVATRSARANLAATWIACTAIAPGHRSCIICIDGETGWACASWLLICPLGWATSSNHNQTMKPVSLIRLVDSDVVENYVMRKHFRAEFSLLARTASRMNSFNVW